MASDPHLPPFFCHPLLWLSFSQGLGSVTCLLCVLPCPSCLPFLLLIVLFTSPISLECLLFSLLLPPHLPLICLANLLQSSWHLLCLHRSSLAYSGFQLDALTSCIYEMGCCYSPQRSHVFPRRVQGRLSRKQFGGLKKMMELPIQGSESHNIRGLSSY